MSTLQPTSVVEDRTHDPVATLREAALANAATVVAVAAYMICGVLSAVAPDAWIWLFQPWLHGLSLAPLRAAGPWFRPGEFALGLVTFGGSVWLVTAAMAGLYNRWSQR